MTKLEHAIAQNKIIRAMGIDDAPFVKERGSPVNFAATICANTRFEGMLWG